MYKLQMLNFQANNKKIIKRNHCVSVIDRQQISIIQMMQNKLQFYHVFLK